MRQTVGAKETAEEEKVDEEKKVVVEAKAAEEGRAVKAVRATHPTTYAMIGQKEIAGGVSGLADFRTVKRHKEQRRLVETSRGATAREAQTVGLHTRATPQE